MAELLTLIEGTEVECTDGSRARLERTLVDSKTKQLRHIVVEMPESESARLVPSSHLQPSTGHVVLDCSTAELETFDPADIVRLVPATISVAVGGKVRERIVFTHNVPEGEVEVLAGEEVRADNARLGRLRGVVIDAEDNSIQQLLVSVGRPFSKRELSVPASFVTSFDRDIVRLAGSKRQLMNVLAA
jgi:sporulation protein YlmC with PRC-barrel domain